MRRHTRQVKIGPVPVGGGAPVSVQSMARRPLEDIDGNLDEIRRAAAAGCHVMRLAVPSRDGAKLFGRIAARSELPRVADTHFDFRTALTAIAEGAAKVRINPGNMAQDSLARVVDAAGARGSIPPTFLSPVILLTLESLVTPERFLIELSIVLDEFSE